MSWWDSTRLRRRADKVRFAGWINLAITCVLCAIAADGFVLVAGSIWAATIMALTYGTAYLIDKRADRVVGR